MLTRDTNSTSLRNILYDTFLESYERHPPTPLADTTRIYADLKADEPLGRVGALAWLHQTARELYLKETKLITAINDQISELSHRPKTSISESHDYTIGEIIAGIRALL